MKALTSSCSKAIVERLGSPSHGNLVHVPDRLEFCFSLRPRNDTRGYNFWFLKLVQNKKGIYPVHAVPSKTDELDLEPSEPELETVESQAQPSEQTNESKFVRVTFQLQKNCSFGEQFLLVGDDPILGSWDPSEALPMTWSDGHLWTVDLDMPAGKSIQFKFILKGKRGDIIWQPGSDRIISTLETMNRITVSEDWENAELQEIIEEDQVAQSNEEPKVDSGMSSSAENLDHHEEELVSNVSTVSSIEDCQTNAVEEPVAELDLQQITGDGISSLLEKPMAMVAENIGASEDFSMSTSYKEDIRNMIQLSEESADSPRNDDIVHNAVEEPVAEPDLQQITGDSISSPVEKPIAIVAENIGASEDFSMSTSYKEDIRNMIQLSEESADSPGNDDVIHNAVEEPVAEPDLQQITGDSISSPVEKPIAIVAENIGASEDFSMSTSYKEDIGNMIQPSEESADSPGNDDIIHNLEDNGNATPLKNQERTVVEGNLFDLEPGPVLVPGLIPPVMPNEEVPGEVQGRTTIDNASEAFESKDQNMPEFSKEQESNDGTPQEINATINDEPQLHENEHEEQSHHHVAPPSMKDRSNSQPVDDGNALQSDIQWGREAVKKFLTKLGLF